MKRGRRTQGQKDKDQKYESTEERKDQKEEVTLVRKDIWTIRQKGEGKGGHRDCERLGEKEERIEEGKD